MRRSTWRRDCVAAWQSSCKTKQPRPGEKSSTQPIDSSTERGNFTHTAEYCPMEKHASIIHTAISVPKVHRVPPWAHGQLSAVTLNKKKNECRVYRIATTPRGHEKRNALPSDGRHRPDPSHSSFAQRVPLRLRSYVFLCARYGMCLGV